jgi:hypothetical protein
MDSYYQAPPMDECCIADVGLGWRLCSSLFSLRSKQQGRLLLCFYAIEEPLESRAPEPSLRHRLGFPSGNRPALFRLLDLEGYRRALQDLPWKDLLVIWSPNCGFHSRTAPELARLKRAFQKPNVELRLLVPTPSQQAQAGSSVLLTQGAPAISTFKTFRTPVPNILDERTESLRTWLRPRSGAVALYGGSDYCR